MAITPVFTVLGVWSGDGQAGVLIDESNVLPPGVDPNDAANYLIVDMSNYPALPTGAYSGDYARPQAQAVIRSPTQIDFTFPDDNAYTATLVPGLNGQPNSIVFSNGSTWAPLPWPIFGPGPALFWMGGRWASGGVPGPFIGSGAYTAQIDMSAYGRPPALLTVAAFGNILVSFQDPTEEVRAFLRWPPALLWSNGSEWTLVRPTVRYSPKNSSDGPILQIAGTDYPASLPLIVTITRADGSVFDAETPVTDGSGVFLLEVPLPPEGSTIDIRADTGFYYPYVPFTLFVAPQTVNEIPVLA